MKTRTVYLKISDCSFLLPLGLAYTGVSYRCQLHSGILNESLYGLLKLLHIVCLYNTETDNSQNERSAGLRKMVVKAWASGVIDQVRAWTFGVIEQVRAGHLGLSNR